MEIRKKQTCEFVPSSELFAGKEGKRIWNQFVECNQDFSWGGNNRSLVTVEAILDCLDNSAIDYSNSNGFKKKCREIGMQTYIDLEN